jgi:hypothetical protein
LSRVAPRPLGTPRAVALHVARATLWVWDVGAIAYSPYADAPLWTALALAFAAAVPAAYLRLRTRGASARRLLCRSPCRWPRGSCWCSRRTRATGASISSGCRAWRSTAIA